MKTHKLYISGFDRDGWTGTIKGRDGKPIYNIDTDNLGNRESVVSNKILAIDNFEIEPQLFKTVRRKTSQEFETMAAFDLNFSVNVDGGKETVARLRLTDEQAEKLAYQLTTRHESLD